LDVWKALNKDNGTGTSRGSIEDLVKNRK
jgi:hypothetical protein